MLIVKNYLNFILIMYNIKNMAYMHIFLTNMFYTLEILKLDNICLFSKKYNLYNIIC